MTNSEILTKDAAEAFSLHAEDYDRWFDDPNGRILFELEVKAIRILMRDLIPPFLEIGVGSGRFAEALGIRYGVDPADALLEMARKRGINAEKASGEKLPFSNRIFGGVFILFTLCFVKDPTLVLSEAKRVLRNDGGLILGIINRESPWGELYARKKAEGHPIYRHARFFIIDEVSSMLEKSAMRVEAYSSTLRQPPSETPYKEPVHDELVEGAGFLCILARKRNERD